MIRHTPPQIMHRTSVAAFLRALEIAERLMRHRAIVQPKPVLADAQ